MSQKNTTTLRDIEDNILEEHYFTAGDAVEAIIMGFPSAHPSLSLLTFCVLVLENGFTVTGESACVSATNFNAETGRVIARANAVSKIWPLMGYTLKQELHKNDAT